MAHSFIGSFRGTRQPIRRFRSTEEGELDLSRPPDGYDSVVGEVGPNLNFDELVVYTEAAALPEFLIVISSDP